MINWNVFDGYASAMHDAEQQLRGAFPVDPTHIADVGACDGLSTVQYLRLWPKARAILFEPVQENFRQCLEVVGHYNVGDRCMLVNTALSSQNGTADFYMSNGQSPKVPIEHMETGNKSSSLLAPKEHLKIHPWCKFRKVRVKTNRADFYLDYYGIRPQFVHMDVQGAEKLVLEGFGRYLDYVKAMWLEVSTVELYRHQPLRSDLCSYLESRGFICAVDTCGNNRVGDCLFVRKG